MKQKKRQRVQWAYSLAKKWHNEQTRDTGERYFEHPRSVAAILIAHGYVKPNYLILAMLHDILEDTTISLSMLERLFGPKVARDALTLSKVYGIEDPLTGYVTHSPKREKQLYFDGIKRRGKRVIVVKCGDRCHNLSDLVDPPADSRWTPQKRLAQVEETRTWILPLAQIHAPSLAKELEHLCALVEAKAQQAIALAASQPPAA